jgi:hypothetical protein
MRSVAEGWTLTEEEVWCHFRINGITRSVASNALNHPAPQRPLPIMWPCVHWSFQISLFLTCFHFRISSLLLWIEWVNPRSKGSSWEAGVRSPGQDIPRALWNPNVHCPNRRGTPLEPVIGSCLQSPPCFSVHFIVTAQCTPRFLEDASLHQVLWLTCCKVIHFTTLLWGLHASPTSALFYLMTESVWRS